jgi:hypothetical protein
MKPFRLKLAAAAAFVLVIGAAVSALTSATSVRACEPLACPAIVKICPQGQLACRPSPCTCAQVCAAEGHGCNAASEPLSTDSGTLEGEGVALAETNVNLMTPVVPEPAAAPGQFCGGIAGIPCPEGFVCKDVPGDGCDPQHGGADCPGRCKRQH